MCSWCLRKKVDWEAKLVTMSSTTSVRWKFLKKSGKRFRIQKINFEWKSVNRLFAELNAHPLTQKASKKVFQIDKRKIVLTLRTAFYPQNRTKDDFEQEDNEAVNCVKWSTGNCLMCVRVAGCYQSRWPTQRSGNFLEIIIRLVASYDSFEFEIVKKKLSF